jgi:hypothetical protein
MKLSVIAATGLAALAMPVSASGIVHLNCSLMGSNGGSAVQLDISLNEAAGTASYLVRQTGATVTERAQFTPTQVKIGDADMMKIIDRTNLNITDGTAALGPYRVFRSGKCEMAPVVERKF